MGNTQCCSSDNTISHISSEGGQQQGVENRQKKRVYNLNDDTQTQPQEQQLQSVQIEQKQTEKKTALDYLQNIGQFPSLQDELKIAYGIHARISEVLPDVINIIIQLQNLFNLFQFHSQPTVEIVQLKTQVKFMQILFRNYLHYYLAINEKGSLLDKQNLVDLLTQLSQIINFFQHLQEQSYDLPQQPVQSDKKDGNQNQQQQQQQLKLESPIKDIVFGQQNEPNQEILRSKWDENRLQIEKYSQYIFDYINAHLKDYQTISQSNLICNNLPGYIQASYQFQFGYSICYNLFGCCVEIDKNLFFQRFKQHYCQGIEDNAIQQIINKLSVKNNISIFAFLSFLHENKYMFSAGSLKIKQEIMNQYIQIQNSQSYNPIEQKEPYLLPDGTYDLNGGYKYKGELIGNKKQGPGILRKEDYLYEGNFVDDEPDGQGREQKRGINYQGSWSKGQYSGQGTLRFEDGTYYVGQFSKNTYNGQGILTDYLGIQYQGEWKEGFLLKGIIIYPGNIKYKGQIIFSKYKEDEKAELHENEQVMFEGKFIFDQPVMGKFYVTGKQQKLVLEGEFDGWGLTGKGKIHFSVGVYEGQIVNCLRQGKGIFTWFDNNNVLDAQWDRDMPTTGIHYFNYSVDKYQRYEGHFENYQKKGKGKFFYPGGGTYEGEIDRDMRNGKGLYIDKDFNKFDGEWKDNLLHGTGKIYFYNQDIYEGEFCEGKMSGQGVLKYSNGTRYEGKWKENKWNGEGKYYNQNGQVEKQGYWENGQLFSDK